MGVIELCVEVDVVGASALNVTNSLLSCGNNIAGNESKVQRFAINLDDDSNDDDYMISNSYVEDSLDEEEDIDDISDIDEEGGSETAFWESASSYSNIKWSHPNEEDICGFDMRSTFNIVQELFVGMEFESKNALKNALQKKAWKAKQKAIMIEYGDWDESYGQLLSWLTHMQNHCPGSYYQICDDDFVVGNTVSREYRQFHRVFWTFGQCKESFKYCKSIIQVDGTFLYGKYRGTLIMATTQDGNGHVLPLAFVVVEGETLTAWSWFLAHLREHVTDKDGICLISDRHASIKSVVANEALGWQPPHAYHVYCVRYITSNFNHKFKNEKQKQMLKKLDRGCKAQRELQSCQIYCSKVMKEIQKNQEKACSHIVRIYDIQRTMFEVEEACNPMSQRGGQKCINFYQYIDVVYTNDHILRAYSPPW
ncbi:hypothetical protein GmHk_06G017336 [Glycine max]|nr:hypothetical protein GmHk_06G017336 [Glycine max]